MLPTKIIIFENVHILKYVDYEYFRSHDKPPSLQKPFNINQNELNNIYGTMLKLFMFFNFMYHV
jgi:hypothetical protein